jgi:thioredoxin-like negative regulator of GroEL
VTATAPQLLQLAERFLKSGDTAKAKVILAALTADPNSDIRNEARFRTAKLLAGEGQTSRAALLLRQVIDERPDALPARLELAGLLDRLGDKEGAWRQVRAAQAL